MPLTPSIGDKRRGDLLEGDAAVDGEVIPQRVEPAEVVRPQHLRHVSLGLDVQVQDQVQTLDPLKLEPRCSSKG